MEAIKKKRSLICKILDLIEKDMEYLRENIKNKDFMITSSMIIQDLKEALSSLSIKKEIIEDDIIRFKAYVNLEIFSVLLEELLENKNYEKTILNNLKIKNLIESIKSLEGPLKLILTERIIKNLELNYSS